VQSDQPRFATGASKRSIAFVWLSLETETGCSRADTARRRNQACLEDVRGPPKVRPPRGLVFSAKLLMPWKLARQSVHTVHDATAGVKWGNTCKMACSHEGRKPHEFSV
jgi:hypothetical protein